MVFLFSNTVVTYFSLNQYFSGKINELFPLWKVHLCRAENNICLYFEGPYGDSKYIIHISYLLYFLLPEKKINGIDRESDGWGMERKGGAGREK